MHDWISYLVHRAHREITKRCSAQYDAGDAIPPVALSVLMYISESPGRNQREIAAELGLDRANAARLIRSLDATGWLVRRHPAHDRRRLGVYLTPQGVRELSRRKRDMRRFEQQLCTQFGVEERAALISLLGRLCWPDAAAHGGVKRH